MNIKTLNQFITIAKAFNIEVTFSNLNKYKKAIKAEIKF